MEITVRPTFYLLCLSLVLGAAAPTAAKDLKIGFIDMNRARAELVRTMSGYSNLKNEVAAKQGELDKKQTELKQQEEEYNKRKKMMKPDARIDKREELQTAIGQLQMRYAELQQELVAKESALLKTALERIEKVIARIGDRDGYEIIINIGDTVVYHKAHQDITDLVVKEYKQQFASN
ncbi:MAG: OmpH family outer membrane protein [Myxococcota bacterium]